MKSKSLIDEVYILVSLIFTLIIVSNYKMFLQIMTWAFFFGI